MNFQVVVLHNQGLNQGPHGYDCYVMTIHVGQENKRGVVSEDYNW